jgi:hypothetical protein
MKSVIGLFGAAVLFAGCSGDQLNYDDEVELGSTVQELVWTGLSPDADVAPTAVREVASCVSGDQMLVAGGETGTASTPTANAIALAFRYDVSQDEWLQSESIMADVSATPRAGAKLIKVPNDDKCILVGGYNGTPAVASDIFIYDFSDNDWNDTGIDLADARYGFDIAFLSSNQVLIFGGATIGGSPTTPTSIEVLTLAATPAITTLVDLVPAAQGISNPAQFLSVVAIDEGRTVSSQAVMEFYVMGGEIPGGAQALDSVERISVRKSDAKFAQRLAIEDLPETKSRFVAFPISQYLDDEEDLQSAKILAAAGVDNANDAKATAFALVPPSGGDLDGSWAPAPSLSIARIRPQTIDVSSVTGQAARDSIVVGGASELPTVAFELTALTRQDEIWDDSVGDWTDPGTTTNTSDGRTDGFALQVIGSDVFAAMGTEANGANPVVRTLLNSIEVAP